MTLSCRQNALNRNCSRFALPAEATCRPEARGFRITAGGLEGPSGALLDAAWELPSLFWRALGGAPEAPGAASVALGEPWRRLGRVGGRPGGVWGGAGAVLEAYKRRLGGSLGRLGAVLGALEAM